MIAAAPSPLDCTLEEIRLERCRQDLFYFVETYCQIYDATACEWIPFSLWPSQAETLVVIRDNRLVVILKARQLGQSWLVLAFALWLMIFHPAATVLIFSRREDEAIYLLGDERLRGMYDRLPGWMKPGSIEPNASKTWALANGSIARAFPTTAGDSYTATLAIVDEADLSPDLGRLMRSVKPTIDGGGRMILLSRPDKSRPESEFKAIYNGAKAGKTPWKAVFLPWNARPDRDVAWREEQKADILARTGGQDDLHEQYPGTDLEALAPRVLDKRLAPEWLQQCYREAPIITNRHVLGPGCPAIPGLKVYRVPVPRARYAIGADPAEGNPTSDDSVFKVLEQLTGEECASLAGKFQPAVFAAHLAVVSKYYNLAPALVERNNHGHAVLLALADFPWLKLMAGTDGNAGWLTTAKSKALLYSDGADAFRTGETVLHDSATYQQLQSIEGATLSAPEGMMDDLAVAYMLALVAVNWGIRDSKTTRPTDLGGGIGRPPPGSMPFRR